ncbi:hypothetical protein Tco_0959582 [Tanacetum coccineum]
MSSNTAILFSDVRCLERGARTHQDGIDAARSRIDRHSDRIDTYDYDLGFIRRDTTRTSDKVLALEDEGRRVRRRVDSREIAERMGWGILEALPSDSIDVLVFYEESQPPEPQGPPDGPQKFIFMFSSVGLLYHH